MTYNQLKNDVAALGFERTVEDEEAFVLAANRALELLFTDRPRERTVTLPCKPQNGRLIAEVIHHRMGEDITVELYGRAYSLRVSGKGSYSITDSSGTRSYSFSTEMETVRGFLSQDASICFSGEYDYSVYGLMCYYTTAGGEISDIPVYSEYREIDASGGYKDFRAFAALPTGEGGQIIHEAILRDGKLLLPRDYVGRISITYYRSPRSITSELGEAQIDVTEECAPLLPLLTASFLWLDDDSDKAQYYMALYRQALSQTMRYSTRAINKKYETNGWA